MNVKLSWGIDMITVKQAKDMGVVFVERDVVFGININSYQADTINNSVGSDHCQVVSFTDRNGDEAPCKLPIIIKTSQGATWKGLACDFNFGVVSSWKPDLEALEKLANEKEQKPMPQKQYTYELVTDLDTNGIAKAMIDGEVFYDGGGHESYKWTGYCFEDNCGRAITIAGKFYRKVEKQIDWREEVSLIADVTFVYQSSYPHSKSVEFIAFNSEIESHKFLEMCRVALRSTGELK